jgi:hypothetical protein
VSEKVLPKLSNGIARYIGKQVWDSRDVISCGKLVRLNDRPEDIAEIISTIAKYNKEGDKNEYPRFTS